MVMMMMMENAANGNGKLGLACGGSLSGMRKLGKSSRRYSAWIEKLLYKFHIMRENQHITRNIYVEHESIQ
jgi:hypothetical protein